MNYNEIKENLRSSKWKLIKELPEMDYQKNYIFKVSDYLILDENSKKMRFELSKDSLKEFIKI